LCRAWPLARAGAAAARRAASPPRWLVRLPRLEPSERSSSKNGKRGRRPSLPRRPYTNASDALEKLRHLRAAGGGVGVVGGGENGGGGGGGGDDNGGGGDAPRDIRIETDEASNTLTITDTGMGMTRAEMASNLGTIARSGSRAFVEEMDQAILAEWSKQRDKWRWRQGDSGEATAVAAAAWMWQLGGGAVAVAAWRRRCQYGGGSAAVVAEVTEACGMVEVTVAVMAAWQRQRKRCGAGSARWWRWRQQPGSSSWAASGARSLRR